MSSLRVRDGARVRQGPQWSDSSRSLWLPGTLRDKHVPSAMWWQGLSSLFRDLAAATEGASPPAPGLYLPAAAPSSQTTIALWAGTCPCRFTR